MKLLVTGGVGFIGSAVVRLHVSRGHTKGSGPIVLLEAVGSAAQIRC